MNDEYLIDENGNVRKRRWLLAYYMGQRPGTPYKFIESVPYREGEEPKIPAGCMSLEDIRRNVLMKSRGIMLT